MADPSPAPAPKWRWNYIPDYAEDRLSKEILEQRLRNKFGNFKFFVEVRSLIFTGAMRC